MNDFEKYLRALFQPGEAVCITNVVQGTELTHIGDAIHMAPTNFVSLNPLHTKRLDANVTAHRNLLFEFDTGTIEEQLEEIVAKRVPYTSLVYSGGKSVHCIIALEEGLKAVEYQDYFKLIRYVLWRSDPTARNPSRLTRAAGGLRGEQPQSLIDLRERTSRIRLDGWLSRFTNHISRCQEREAKEQAAKEEQLAKRAQGAGIEAVDPMTLRFLRGEIGTKGSRHARLVAAACELAECGVEYAECLELLGTAADLHGITADPKRANEAVEVATYAYKR